jgi:hypothetical protein
MAIVELKQLEEQKRERCWDPRQRWQVLQQTIDWVDSQQPVPRNSRQGCLARQSTQGVGNLFPQRPGQMQR